MTRNITHYLDPALMYSEIRDPNSLKFQYSGAWICLFLFQMFTLGPRKFVFIFFFSEGLIFYFILFYFILFYFILFYFIYFILFYFILFYFILFYFFQIKVEATWFKSKLRHGVIASLSPNECANNSTLPKNLIIQVLSQSWNVNKLITTLKNIC